MSDQLSRSDVDRLIDSLDRLTIAVRETQLGTASVLEGWELVEEVYPGPAREAVRHHRAEEPPPETPAQILGLAKRLTSAKGDGNQRVTEAFRAGYWARLSLECHIHQLDRPTLSTPLRATQHLILRATGLEHPVRVLKAEERDKLIGGDTDAIFFGFPSLIEVQAFCSGAGIEVPALYKCRNTESGSAARVTPRS